MTYCDFKPGDEVIAVDNGGCGPGTDLVIGAIYTVRRVFDPDAGSCPCCGGNLAVEVEEIDNRDSYYGACSFRKIQRRDIGKWLKQSVGNTDRLDKSVKTSAKEDA